MEAASRTVISSGTRLDASVAGEEGDGGGVWVWSQEETEFYGRADTRPGTEAGEGGFVELSSAGTLKALEAKEIRTGRGDRAGTVLLDPKNITVTSDPPTSFRLIMSVIDQDLQLSGSDNFGESVSYTRSGGKLAIGAPNDDTGGTNPGAVYLFDTATPSLPYLTAKIDSSHAGLSLSDNDKFGTGVAYNGAGDRLVAGAPNDDTVNKDSGAVYLFDTSTPSSPTLTTTLDNSSLTDLTLHSNDSFGTSVSYNRSGDRLAVGAPFENTVNQNSGAVYLFDTSELVDGDPDTSSVSKMAAIDNNLTSFTLSKYVEFGTSASFNGVGDRLAAGAPGDSTGHSDAGAVYLFDTSQLVDGDSNTSSVSEMVKLDDGSTGFDLAFNDIFGTGVSYSGSGEKLAAGAPNDNSEGKNKGAVYLFDTSKLVDGDPDTDSVSKTLKLDDGEGNWSLSKHDRFGRAVSYSGSGERLAVGTPKDDAAGSNAGAVYLFDTSSSSLNFTNKIDDVHVDFALSDGVKFGKSVSYDGEGDQLAAGAPKDSTGPGNAGAVYLFNTTVPSSPRLTTKIDDSSHGGLNLSTNDVFGTGVSYSGSGDRLAVGAPNNGTEAKQNSGTVFLFDTSTPSAPEFTTRLDDNYDNLTLNAFDYFGQSVSYNGEGDRLAAGAREDSTSETSNSGAVYLFDTSALVDGDPATSSVSQMEKLDGNNVSLSSSDKFGMSVSYNRAGDRLAAGAPNDDSQGTNQGAVYLFDTSQLVDGDSDTDSVSGLPTIDSSLTGFSLNDQDRFGRAVSYNGAGDRLAAGAPNAEVGDGTNQGAVYLFDTSDLVDGDPATDTVSRTATLDDSHEDLFLSDHDHFGRAVSYNGSGERLAVGVPDSDTGGSNRGGVYLFDTSASTPDLTTKIDSNHVTHFTLSNGDNFGTGVSYNGAGDQLAAGAPGDSTSIGNGGAVYLFDTAVPSSPRLTTKIDNNHPALSLDTNDSFGTSVSYNRSGEKLAVGAPLENTVNQNSGAVYLFDTSVPSAPRSTATIDNNLTDFSLSSYVNFGTSVSYNGEGDRLAAGAPGDSSGPSDAGAVYLFDTDALSSPIKLDDGHTAVDLSSSDNFGTSVSYNRAGDRLAAGAPNDDSQGTNQGAVYLFDTSQLVDGDSDTDSVSGLPTIDSSLTGFSLNDQDRFGRSASFNGAGDRLAAGAPKAEVGDGSNQGAVYLFDTSDLVDGDPDTDSVSRAAALDDSHEDLSLSDHDHFGESVSYNGAGQKLAVGADDDDTGGNNRGIVYKFNSIDKPAEASFDTDSQEDFIVFPSDVEALLDGSDLTLQANNDIDVDSAIDATGNSGNGMLSLQAGRDVNVNADILLNGAFSATANASGAQASNRDSGAGGINVSATIDTSGADGALGLAVGAGPGGTTAGTISEGTLKAGAGSISLDFHGDVTETIDVSSLQTTGQRMIKGSAGENSFTITGEAGSGSLVVKTLGENDSLALDFSGSKNPVPGSGIAFKGGGQSGAPGDVLNFNNVPGASATDGFLTHTYNMDGSDTDGNDGSVVLNDGSDNHTVTFTDLEPITNDGVADKVIFNLTGSADDVVLQNDSDGDSELIDNGSGTVEDTTFANPNKSVTVNGQAGDDTIGVNGMDSDFSATVKVNGGDSSEGDTAEVRGALDIGGLEISAETININAGVTTSKNETTETFQTSGAQSYDGNTQPNDAITLDAGGGVTFKDLISPAGPGTVGTLNVKGDFTLDTSGSIAVTLNGTSSFDQIDVDGGVDLSSASTPVASSPESTANVFEVDTTFTILDNDGSDEISNAPSPDPVRISGQDFDSEFPDNDLALTRISTLLVWDNNDGSPDTNWSTGDNWDTGHAPLDQDRVLFPDDVNETSNNDIDELQLASITFADEDGADNSYTLTGERITLGEEVTNSSGQTQTVSLPIDLSGDTSLKAAAGKLVFNGAIDGASAGEGDLSLKDSNTDNGNDVIEIDESVGATSSLAGFTVDSSLKRFEAANGTIETTGAQAYGADVNASGGLDLLAEGGVTDTDTAAITAGGTTTLEAPDSAVMLDSAGNDFDTVKVVEASGVTINDKNGMTLDSFTFGGDLTARVDADGDSSGTTSEQSDLTVNGTVSAGAVDLKGTAEDEQGTNADEVVLAGGAVVETTDGSITAREGLEQLRLSGGTGELKSDTGVDVGKVDLNGGELTATLDWNTGSDGNADGDVSGTLGMQGGTGKSVTNSGTGGAILLADGDGSTTEDGDTWSIFEDVDIGAGNGETVTFDANVHTADGINVASDQLNVNEWLGIGDAPSDDETGTLTAQTDVELGDTAVLDVTLNAPGKLEEGGDYDQLVVESGNELTLNDPGFGGKVTDGAFNVRPSFPVNDVARVIENDGSLSGTGTIPEQFSQVQFKIDGEDFEVRAGDVVGFADANDLFLERILKRFVWTGEGDTQNWFDSGNWADQEVPEEKRGVVFDTALSGETSQTVTVDPSGFTGLGENKDEAKVEQVRFAEKGTTTSPVEYTITGPAPLTLVGETIQTGLKNDTNSPHAINATLQLSDTSVQFPSHDIVTSGELVIQEVTGTHPMRLVGRDGGALRVNRSTVDIRLDTVEGNTLTALELNTTGNVEVVSDLTVSGPVQVPEGTVRTPAGANRDITTSGLTIGDRMEVGDLGNNFGHLDGVGTLSVNGGLVLNGATVETTLASHDQVIVNGDEVTLNSPSMDIETDTEFDETVSFRVIDNNGSKSISGSFADLTLVANSQEYLVDVNAGDGNDIVLDRRDTERVDPTSTSTDRGGGDEITSTTQVNATGEDGLDETVTDELSDDEMDQLVTVLDDEVSDGDDVPETATETGREFLYGELGGSLGSRRYNQQLVARYSSRAEDLEAQLRLLEQTTDEEDRDEATQARMEQLREAVDELRARADSAEQRLAEDQADGEEDEDAEVEEAPGLDQIPSLVQEDGQPDEVDGTPSVSAVDRHTLRPDQDLENITATQMRDQLRNDLQFGVFSDSLSKPLQAAVWTSLEQNSSVQAPNPSALREIAGAAAREAQQKGNEQLAGQLRTLQRDIGGWNSEDVMQFRTTAGGDTGWGSATVEVFLNRSTGDYLMTADVMINENAANRSKGTTFGEYAGDTLEGYEGGFHTMTLTGSVE